MKKIDVQILVPKIKLGLSDEIVSDPPCVCPVITYQDDNGNRRTFATAVPTKKDEA